MLFRLILEENRRDDDKKQEDKYYQYFDKASTHTINWKYVFFVINKMFKKVIIALVILIAAILLFIAFDKINKVVK